MRNQNHADNIALIAQDSNPEAVKTKAIQTIQVNLQEIGLDLATEKTELLWFGNSPRKSENTSIHIDNINIRSKPVVKFLGTHRQQAQLPCSHRARD